MQEKCPESHDNDDYESTVARVRLLELVSSVVRWCFLVYFGYVCTVFSLSIKLNLQNSQDDCMLAWHGRSKLTCFPCFAVVYVYYFCGKRKLSKQHKNFRVTRNRFSKCEMHWKIWQPCREKVCWILGDTIASRIEPY